MQYINLKYSFPGKGMRISVSEPEFDWLFTEGNIGGFCFYLLKYYQWLMGTFPYEKVI